MKYPASHLTPSVATLRQDPPGSCHSHSPNSHTAKALSCTTSIVCRLLKSLASLFEPAVVCFQGLAASFRKTPGWGCLGRLGCPTISDFQEFRPADGILLALVFKNLRIATSAPSICIPRVFTHLQTAFFPTPLFSKTSALPPSFLLFLAARHSPLATSQCYREP